MKKMMFLAVMMVMTVSAAAMSYTQAKSEALFLSDKMAYELNLTDAQYNAVYEINLDYLLSVNGHNDIFGTWWNRRNTDLQYVLTVYQYNKYTGLSYFYRPLSWKAGALTFNIYSHYSNRSHFYKTRPGAFVTYKGGNNKKSANHYADWKHSKNDKDNGKTWRNTEVNNGKGHGGSNHHFAQNKNKDNNHRSFGINR